MAVCGKCVHKNVCELCKALGFENVVNANDFNCKDYLASDDVVITGTCDGCKNISFSSPYASMYPCVNCVRANRKDYYERGKME